MSDVTVKFGGDTSKFSGEVSKMKKGLEGLKGVFAGLAVYFSGRQLISFTKNLIDTTDQIGKSAKRIGVTAEEFQKLSFAARRSGASTESIEKAFKRMSSVILDAENGLTENVRALGELGYTYDQLKGKKPEEQFGMIASALSMITDESKKTALAQDLFGRAGTELIPMLSNYEDLAAELENIGGIISDENVKAAEEFKDMMENLGMSIRNMVAESGLLEWLADIVKSMNDILTAKGMLSRGEVETSRTATPSVSREFLSRALETFIRMTSPSSSLLFARMEEEGEVIRMKAASKEELMAKKETQERKKEQKELIELKQQEANIDKELEKYFGELDKASEKYFKDEEKRAKEAEKKAEKEAEFLQDLKHEIEIQEMINNKLEKEAAIKERLYRLEKTLGRAATEEEKALIETAVAADAKLKEAPERAVMQPEIKETADVLARVGGQLGEIGVRGIKENLDKQRNKQLEEHTKLLASIDSKMGLTEGILLE